jgi:hypothetical protein
MHKQYRVVRLFLLLGLLVAFIPSFALAVESTVINRQVNDCHIKIEFNTKWKVMTVRSARNDYEHCNIERNTLVSVLRDAFKQLSTEDEDKEVKSIFLGRAISYPWLSEYIKGGAEKSRAWDLKHGKPKKGYLNAFVAGLIYNAEVVGDLNAILKPHGLYVSGISVEKVLVAEYALTTANRKGKLPYDAMVWIVISSDSTKL